MNILYYYRETDAYMHKWQHIHFIDELAYNGINIEIFNPLNYYSIDEANEKLVKYVKAHKYDLFMTCVWADYLYKESIIAIKKQGIPTLLICFDNLHAPYIHKKIAAIFDVVWLTSMETKYLFKKWGCKNIIFQTYAANPFLFKPNWSKTIPSVNFIGTPYGSRILKINAITKKNILCDLYSDKYNGDTSQQNAVGHTSVRRRILNLKNNLSFDIGRKMLWATIKHRLFYNDLSVAQNDYMRIHPSVSFEKMNELYANHALSLNILEVQKTYVLKSPIHKIHLRTFEIPMCGGLEFTNYTDELTNYFEDGKEIVLYHNEEDMIDKARFYLNPKQDRLVRKMKESAYARSISEHTWTMRFEQIFKRF